MRASCSALSRRPSSSSRTRRRPSSATSSMPRRWRRSTRRRRPPASRSATSAARSNTAPRLPASSHAGPPPSPSNAPRRAPSFRRLHYEQASRHNGHQRRAGRVFVRGTADPARCVARRTQPDRLEGRLRLGRLRRLQRHRRRQGRLLLPDARVEAEGKSITTVEGVAQGDKLHPVQQKFLEHAALQCGFCTPGFIVAAKALLDENKNPTEEETRYWLAGNLCRCTGYDKIVRAVLDAAAVMRGENPRSPAA